MAVEQKSKIKKKRAELVEAAREAISEIVTNKAPSYEDTIEDLEELQATIESYIDGFRDDIKTRDE